MIAFHRQVSPIKITLFRMIPKMKGKEITLYHQP